MPGIRAHAAERPPLRLWIALLATTGFAAALRGAAWWGAQPSLGQVRYASVVAGPAALLLALVALGAWRPAARRWGALLLGGVACVAGGADLQERLRNPAWHDDVWKARALALQAEVRPEDLILCVTGVVETRLVPVRYADPGFQEYCTSRLGPAYLPAPTPRLALPAPFPRQPGPWLESYAERARATLARNGTVHLVASADTDLGTQAEQAATAWLAELGARPLPRGPGEDNPIGRHTRFRRP
jgi:hypothetical protein